jgi:hypothetical protein
MTSHDFDAWQDSNCEPQDGFEQQRTEAQRDALARTLRDVCALADADLAPAEALHRCRRIALASLQRCGLATNGHEPEQEEVAEIAEELSGEPPF